ncbi:MAG: hypothetical protein KBC15_03930 [Candidatus Levybacteria bacterium]|nr:hypothetical protein [Candidatus Levybacteria bacterium]
MRRFLLAILVLFLVATPAFALSTDEEPIAASTSGTTVQKSDYILVYPGILPNNPLYGIKMIRDKIILLLITDPTKKIKFNLIQSDKRLGAGIMLWESDHSRVEDAIETISKGQNYFASAVADTNKLTGEGRDTSGLRNDLVKAAQKHKEVLDEWIKKVPEKNKPMAKALSARINAFRLQVEGLN